MTFDQRVEIAPLLYRLQAESSGSPVAVLFARADSIYKSIGNLDVFDAERDARNYQGPHPIIAHPPCRGWGCLRMMSKVTPEEKALGSRAVEQVRKWGGVLEHPRGSTFWKAAGLPRSGAGPDFHGGFTLMIEQWWWGHRAQKATWLYICGCTRAEVPAMPLKFGTAPNVVTNIHGLRSGMPGYRKEITEREREATPPAFAAWLVDLARVCRIKIGSGFHARTLARFIEKPKRGSPTFFSYSDKPQLKFPFYDL
jgi:hypothetical protein